MTAGRTRFARVPVGAAGDRTLNTSALRVLIGICAFADAEGNAWPSLPTISAATGIEACNIPRAIGALEKAGLLARAGWHRNRTGRSRRYRIVYMGDNSSNQKTSEQAHTSSAETTTAEATKSSGQTTTGNGSTSSDQTTSSNQTTSSRQTQDVVQPDDYEGAQVVWPDDQTAHLVSPAHLPAHSSAKPRADLLGRREPTPAAADGFEAFWNAYPRRQDKGHARKAYTAALRKAPAATILAGLARYRFSEDPKFIPLATTWLTGERWADETRPAPNKSPAGHDRAAPAQRNGRLDWLHQHFQAEPDEPVDYDIIEGTAE